MTGIPAEPEKIGRLPWEKSPYVDRKAATDRALRAAAPRAALDPKSKAVQSYAQKALSDEIESLKSTPEGGGEAGGRNKQLFKSAANLFELVAAGVLGENEVYDALRSACVTNGSEADDGVSQVERTIASGRRKGLDNPRDLSRVGQGGGSGFIINDASVKAITLDGAYALERVFWTARESLQTIYVGALAGMCSPWAVLAYCVARALTLVRPNATLPPIIGGPGSLNWFCAVVALSGGGKGASLSVARQLVPEYVHTRNLGSGEGLIDAHHCKPSDENPDGRRESIMWVADEIDTMAALGTRNGSTLTGMLRSAFSGEQLGFSYRKNGGNDKHLEPHSYRTTLVVNVQPAKAGALLDDTAGGMLQRFMWFPGTDPRITFETPLMPAPLTIPNPGVWLYPRELKIPYEAHELIKDERVRQAHGEQDPLDGHAMFIREKFAFALAVLDGRDEMTIEDWNLAGIASRVSNHTRLWVAQELGLSKEDDAEEQGKLRGVALDAANTSSTRREWERNQRVANRIMAKIRAVGRDGITENELCRMPPARDRPFIKPRLEEMIRQKVVEKIEPHERDRSDRWALVPEDEEF